jgi:hypothetical protein
MAERVPQSSYADLRKLRIACARSFDRGSSARTVESARTTVGTPVRVW